MIQKKQDRLASLNSLRAIGALMLILFHLTYLIDFPEYLTTAHDRFRLALQLFLLLSALSIYYGYFDHLTNRKEIKAYFVRRFLRIAPLFYFLMAVWGIAFILFPTNGAFILFPNGKFEFPITEYLLNFTFLFNLFPATVWSIVPIAWTIGVLYIFYLLVPILIAFIRRIWTALIVLVATLFLSTYFWDFLNSIPGMSILFINGNIITQLPFFIIGILCFFLVRGILERGIENHQIPNNQSLQTKIIQNRLIKIIPQIVTKRFGKFVKTIGRVFIKRKYNILGIVLIMFAIFLADIVPLQGPMLLYAWGLPLIFLIIGFILYPCRIYVNRITNFIGDRSYGIYLIHPLVIAFSWPLYTNIYNRISDTNAAFLISFLYTVIMILIISSLTYKFIEQVAVKYGSSFLLKKEKG